MVKAKLNISDYDEFINIDIDIFMNQIVSRACEDLQQEIEERKSNWAK